LFRRQFLPPLLIGFRNFIAYVLSSPVVWPSSRLVRGRFASGEVMMALFREHSMGRLSDGENEQTENPETEPG
jgi:hypothetical protein